MDTPGHQSRAWLLWLAMLAAMGAAAVMACTARGVMANPDSAAYMGGAQSLAAGRGYELEIYAGPGEPLTHFPPFLSVVLAAPAALRWDLLEAARWLDALMLAGSVLIVGWLVYRHTADKALAVLGAALAVTGPPMLEMHTSLLSEPLFLFLVLLGILLLDRHLRRPRMSLLLGSAVAFSLAQLTRWAAAPFIGAAGLVLLVGGTGRATRRLWESVLFGLVALLPAALWVARNVAVGGNAADRTLVFHPVTIRHLKDALATVASWVMPHKLAEATWMRYLVLATLVGLVAAGYVLWRRTRTDDSDVLRQGVRRPPYLLLAVSVAYLAFLAVSLSFFDASILLSDRTLVPMYLTAVVLALWLAKLAVLSLRNERARKTATAAICLVCALVFVPQAAQRMAKRSRDGAGYTRQAWRESPTLKAALARASSVPVYANNAAAFYVLGGVRVHPLPRTVNPMSTLPNRLYGEQFAEMVEDMRARGGVIVLFQDREAGRPSPAQDRRLRDLPLQLLQSFSDGAIYGMAPR